MQFAITNKLAEAASTKYQYKDSDVYWTILGRKVAGGDFYYMDPQGNLHPISTGDNTHSVPGYTGEYADYSYNYAEHLPPVFSEQVVSGRLYISLRGPLWIHVNGPGDYAAPSATNPSVAGYYTIYDKVEFTFEPGATPALHCNTTCVDFLGIPVTMEVEGTRVGFSADRSTVVDDFEQCADSNFADLIIPGQSSGDAPLRILNPAAVMTTVVPQSVYDYFSSYFRKYIDDVWTGYRTKTLTLTIYGVQYTGKVGTTTVTLVTPQPDGQPPLAEQAQVEAFRFSQGATFDDNAVIAIIPKPGTVGDPYGASGTEFLKSPVPEGTMAVLGCNNVFAAGDATSKNIQKFIAAGMNRTLTGNADPGESNWCAQADDNYTNQPVEYYAKILHANSLSEGSTRRCYAFSYDDVCDQSSSLTSDNPNVVVRIELPAWD